jgi:hypothetical protein
MLKDAKEFWSKVDENHLDFTAPGSMRISSSFDEEPGSSTMVSKQLSSSFPQWFLPSSRRSNSYEEHSLIKMIEDEDKFEIALDVQAYKPDELKVRLY